MSDKQRSASQVEGKHTPGPWEVTGDGDIIESKKCQVGEVYFYSYEEGERIDIPYRANARLMAAAPELLEFVEDVAEGLDTGGNPGHLEDAVENLEERAQRIIARIKGDE